MGRLEVELQMLDFFQDRLARIIKLHPG